MGLDINAVLFLVDAHRRGARYDTVLTLGRQDLNVYPETLRRVLSRHGFSVDQFAAEDRYLYADPLFRQLGARQVLSLDQRASQGAFEGAQVALDLNEPLPAQWREHFDLVYDGGTLEHIFNFPKALGNCMDLVKVGGRLILHTVTNSYCGHGFYQFSPELFYRTLSAENGFCVERMILHGVGPYGRWYEVANPAELGRRVELISWRPMQLLVEARRLERRPLFVVPPQQSDYVLRWDPPSGPAGSAAAAVDYAPSRPALSRAFPRAARLWHVVKMAGRLLEGFIYWLPANRAVFRPVRKP